MCIINFPKRWQKRWNNYSKDKLKIKLVYLFGLIWFRGDTVDRINPWDTVWLHSRNPTSMVRWLISKIFIIPSGEAAPLSEAQCVHPLHWWIASHWSQRNIHYTMATVPLIITWPPSGSLQIDPHVEVLRNSSNWLPTWCRLVNVEQLYNSFRHNDFVGRFSEGQEKVEVEILSCNNFYRHYFWGYHNQW